MIKRTAMFAYGVASYLVFLGTFLYAVVRNVALRFEERHFV